MRSFFVYWYENFEIHMRPACHKFLINIPWVDFGSFQLPRDVILFGHRKAQNENPAIQM